MILGSGSPAASDEDVILAMELVEKAGVNLREKAIYKEKKSALMGLGSDNKEVADLYLKYLEGKDMVEVAVSALKDKDSGVRWAAAYALGKIKDPRAVEPLISALKDEHSSVRKAAAKALGELKDPRAVEPLISALRDKYSGVRWEAAEALQSITGENFGENYEEWSRWWNENKGRFLK